jgi:hypothetical protein
MMSQTWIADQLSMRSVANVSHQIRRQPPRAQKPPQTPPIMDHSVKNCRLIPSFHVVPIIIPRSNLDSTPVYS